MKHIKFEVENCMPCKFSQQMLTTEFPDIKVKNIDTIEEAEEGVLNVFLITDKTEDVAKELQVTSAPTFLTINKSNEVVNRFSGMNMAELQKLGETITKES